MPTPEPAAEARARRYVLIVAALAGGVLGLLAALNYWVDPNGYFSRNTLGFYSVTAERQFKFLGLQRHPNDAVLIGNSKAAMANTSPIRQPFVFFNAGIGASLIEDILVTLQHISPTAPLVVVELDYLQFNNTANMGKRFAALDNSHNALDNLFSLQVTGSSFKTIAGVVGHLPLSYLPDGAFVPTRWFDHYDHGDTAGHIQILNDYETLLRGYRIVPDRVALLEKLRVALEARGKPYLVYLHPTNTEEMVRIRRVGLGPTFDAWRARVHQVFPQVTDLTDSAYADPKNYYRQDVVHPYPDVGLAMLQKEVLPKFGK